MKPCMICNDQMPHCKWDICLECRNVVFVGGKIPRGTTAMLERRVSHAN